MPQGQSREEDLKRREYRGKDGQIHHHTHPYMDRRGDGEGASKAKSGAKSDGRSASAKSSGASGARSTSSKSRDRGGGAQTTTDHDEIRAWAEAHGGRPAAVASTHKGGDVGIVRIMFPDAPNSEHDDLVEISWDEFFAEFEKRKLALLYDPDSLFSKVIGRDTAEKRAHGDNKAAR